jgi:membrane protein
VVNRLIAFGLLLSCALLVLAAVLANFALSLMTAFTDWLPYSSVLLVLAQLALTVLVLTIAFAGLYWVLPYPLAAWGDVWPAALIAAVLFTALQQLAELIFSLINFASYGALGGAMTLLLWIYLCAQILLVGAEISYAWAHIIGSRADRPPPPQPVAGP